MENLPYAFAIVVKLSQQMHSLEEDVFILLCKIFCKLCLTIISTATVARTLNWTARPHIPFLSWHNRVNARKIVQTKTFTNEKVQKFKGVENFHAGYMDFMSGDLLHMYTGKFKGGGGNANLACQWVFAFGKLEIFVHNFFYKQWAHFRKCRKTFTIQRVHLSIRTDWKRLEFGHSWVLLDIL